MRLFRIFTFFFLIFACGLAMSAQAQEKVDVRTSSQKGYSRLVFEWASKPDYSVAKEGGRVKVRFSRAGTPDLSGINASEKNIGKIDVLSGATEPLQMAVAIPDGSRFRDFIVGNKMILDVYDSADGEVMPPVTAQSETTPPPAKAQEPEPAAAAPPVKASPPAPEAVKKTGEDFTLRPVDSGPAAPVTDVEANQVPAQPLDAHIVTLTSTTSMGVSAYRRSGWLWIVLDVPDLQAEPQVTGPQKDRFPKPEKIAIPDGTAYRIEIPENMHVYSDGGGLSWRFYVTPKQRTVRPVQAVTEPGEGKLMWPLKDMRKVLTFTDPVVGDKVTAVTAISAQEFTGDARRFVHLDTLDSVAGLAFVPKADDVKAEIAPQGVTVSRPDGLSLSQARDVEAGRIREAMKDEPKPEEQAAPGDAPPSEALRKAGDPPQETPSETAPEIPPPEAAALESDSIKVDIPSATKEELSKAAGEKPGGDNIYNFSRWEMGGISALDDNMHVMMIDVSGQKDDARGEDILTMAKLNLANNRAPEALGLLRIALQKVPELEDNGEFNALRGASYALSGKYDEAILDLSRSSLGKYNDVKYWLAYTLAGLEDWKQAIAVMPKSFDAIAEYPKQIRSPLALTFAEIALRAGDVPLAERILDILKPELPQLALPYASSWNYLAGEAQRQAGNYDRAEEYWEPLVKNGKDDLFRAKAGLSLTKLRLDRKEIKPAEAINTLEGLRYAWRGDELETLINYRLGQMYIDNKDYLKGLTVLRNASSLSPGSDISQDVKSYMTKAYRDVFANDRLNAISPLEAISLHEEFKDILPPGAEGDAYIEKLAERLVQSDLLTRASTLLEYLVNNRLQGAKKVDVAIRLAAIRLLDGNPDGALRSLEIAQTTLDKLSGAVPANVAPQDIKPEAGGDAKAATAAPAAATAPAAEKIDPEKQRQIYLLKARALSMKKKTDDAMAILEGMRLDADVNRLRADIAWTAGRWQDAADALNDLIVAEDISPKRPLTEYQTGIILNRAIALNLSSNRVALANLRERFNPQMRDTVKGQMFEVVTRPRRPDMIGSREAIESMISEIDLFQGFLDGYSKMEPIGGGTKEPAPVKEPVAADGAAAKPGATDASKTPAAEAPAAQAAKP